VLKPIAVNTKLTSICIGMYVLENV
jgi:hypothetical protein